MAVAVADVVLLNAGDTQEELFINGLIQGGMWDFQGNPRLLTYSLHGDGVTPMSSQLRLAIPKAFQAWEDVANIEFGQLIGSSIEQSPADLALTAVSDELTGSGVDLAGLGFFPDPDFVDVLFGGTDFTRDDYPNPEGDVFLFTDVPDFGFLNPGGRGYADILHEIGHALGLKHPHDDGVNQRPTFAELGLTEGAVDYDDGSWTLMSYFDPYAASGLNSGYQATPMPLDILAIQHIYGANMSYRTGDDTYALKADGQVRTLWDAGGIDTLDASALKGPTVLSLAAGEFAWYGANAATAIAFNVLIENAFGSPFDDDIYGNSAANMLDGRGGADYLYGGLGDDTYVIDNIADNAYEYAGEGMDSVHGSISLDLAWWTEVEDGLLLGSADLDLYGNELDNVLTGNTGSNALTGGVGSDTLIGGMGDDFYILYDLSDLADVIIELPEEGFDTVATPFSFSLDNSGSLENISLLSDGDFNATGNRQSNTLFGNEGRNVLDGGRGMDGLIGGAGDDVYKVDQAGDRALEDVNAGFDEVFAQVSYVLGVSIEKLTLGSSAGNLDGRGNAQENVITGNDGMNTLDGFGGNDVLYGLNGDDVINGGNDNDMLHGGLGQDLLSGGMGNDYFVFDSNPATGGNADWINDFVKGQDKLVLDEDFFVGIGTGSGAINGAAFFAGVGVLALADAANRVLYDSGTGALYYDADGSGFEPAVLIATLAGLPGITAADLFVTS